VLADGSLAAVSGSYLYKLNGTSGAAEAVLALPTSRLSYNTDFNGMAGWPDGTLVLKSAILSASLNSSFDRRNDTTLQSSSTII
jgi:hypothetical protein